MDSRGRCRYFDGDGRARGGVGASTTLTGGPLGAAAPAGADAQEPIQYGRRQESTGTLLAHRVPRVVASTLVGPASAEELMFSSGHVFRRHFKVDEFEIFDWAK